MLTLKPISLRDACAFIQAHHRHHTPPRGCKFSFGVMENDKLVGVAVVGRPIARHVDDGYTAEVTRLCTDGTPNACSLLYGAAARAAKAVGYRKIITYILEDENGASLRASGWLLELRSAGGSWSRVTRARSDNHPLSAKTRWSRELASRPKGLFD